MDTNITKEFWERLYDMSRTIEYFPWIFERIAPYVFNNNFKIQQK
jgi:hypothetical protein